jgi:hypothetical protein
MTFTTLTGDLYVTTTGDPQGDDTFPGVPYQKVEEFKAARVPLIDFYPIDPSLAYDETQTKNFDYTGPATDPTAPRARRYMTGTSARRSGSGRTDRW